jgi:hypothetical protein
MPVYMHIMPKWCFEFEWLYSQISLAAQNFSTINDASKIKLWGKFQHKNNRNLSEEPKGWAHQKERGVWSGVNWDVDDNSCFLCCDCDAYIPHCSDLRMLKEESSKTADQKSDAPTSMAICFIS